MYIWLHVEMSSAIQRITYSAAFLSKQELTFEIQHLSLSKFSLKLAYCKLHWATLRKREI